MNKVSRLLGSTALATGLIFGGSAGAAVAGDNDRDERKSSYHDKRDNKHDNERKDNRNRYGHNHNHERNGHNHDRSWNDRYGYVYDHGHNHHDDDCNGKYHRAWYKNNHGEWRYILILVKF